jgi:hypothetical protein
MKTKFQALAKAKWIQPIVEDDGESLYALIPEGKAVIAKLSSLIVNLKSNIFWIANLKEILHVTSLLFAEVEEAVNNGVTVTAIIEGLRPEESQIKQIQHNIKLESGCARFHQHPLNRFAVFDGKEAMISTNKRNEAGETSALWTTDANLIGVLTGYFETAWSESEELKLINKQLN